MTRPRWTNRTLLYHGPTVTKACRFAEDDVKFAESKLGTRDLFTFSDVLQDALSLWRLLEEQADDLR
jgi:hypothetical protein